MSGPDDHRNSSCRPTPKDGRSSSPVTPAPTDEFTVGDSFDVRAVDTSDKRYDVGYAIVKVVDGTTVADAQAQGLDELGDEDSGTYLWSTTTQEGTQRFMSGTLDVAGTWLLYCFLPSGGTQVYSTTINVRE